MQWFIFTNTSTNWKGMSYLREQTVFFEIIRADLRKIDQSVRQRSFCYCYKLVSHTLTLEDVSSRRRKLAHRTVTTWKASPGLEAGANLCEAQRTGSSASPKVSPSDRRASTLIRQSSHCLGSLRTKGTRRVFHLSGSNVLPLTWTHMQMHPSQTIIPNSIYFANIYIYIYWCTS